VDPIRQTTSTRLKQEAAHHPRTPSAKSVDRLPEIDALRGLAIVLMALDHTRDYFGDHSIDALDLTHTNIALFLARWITHFCAPTFVCLAGISVFLGLQHKPVDKPFLIGLATRGFWLVVLEQTLLRCFGWYFNFDYHYMNAGILWGIGWAMVLLALVLALRFTPIWILVLGVFLIAGHGLLANLAGHSWWSTMLLRSDDLESAGWHFFVSYPVLPWFGIMAFGYGIAGALPLTRISHAPVRNGHGVNRKGRPRRVVEQRWTIGLTGIALLVAFVCARLFNQGDPTPWALQPQPSFTALSFANLEKYPPSIDFSLLTLGVMFGSLAVIDLLPKLMVRFLVNLGRVPLFFYLTHIVLIHLLAVVLAFIRFGRAEWLYQGPGIFWSETLPGHPEQYGLSLGWFLLLWALVITVLYPACLAYGRYKQFHDYAWLRYV
jgi:uncharacterized membrane protein